jgi:predicted nucleotide-binding protein (sugar kinase/HSP70/actin superfamily)
MANLIGKEIIVPPDPGLLGAFGVALEVKNRMDRGELAKKTFDLKTLAHREIEYGKSFTCAGGGTKCDRKCEISMMIIDGNKYPFGGACNKYYNLLKHVSFDEGSFDFVRVRQELLFDTHAGKNPEITGGPEKIISIGVSRAFLTNMLFPLFSHFFTHLGCRVVLSDEVSPDGIKLKRTTLCYPAEISHGCFYNLLRKDLDFIFLPKIIELSVENSISKKRQHQCCCMLLQSEAYCLKSAFKGCAIQATVLSPALDFSQGWDTQQEVFVKLGLSIGKGPVEALAAYRRGVQKQREFFANLKAIGKEQLKLLESAPHKTAVVLFGRPYNAFASEANLGIPGKFASAGTAVIPWDFLPIENEPCDVDMCWAIGQNLMKAASFVEKHPQLFGAFITNFSCGPDSFLVGYFRDIMKTKPSLTLELDSHTADAGVNTRIEAFLDIVKRYRAAALRPAGEAEFLPARVTVEKGKAFFISSDNERVSLHDRRVHVVFPSMGKLSSEIMASIFTGIGIRSSALPVYDFEALKLGRGNSSCKECLPLQLTTGGLLKYLKHRTDPDELFVYFMPTTPGNCRFTQYSVFLNKLIAKNKLRNVALLTLTNEDSYAFLAPLEQYHTLQAIIVSDIMEDIKNALAVLAADSTKGLETFERQWDRIKAFFGQKRRRGLSVLLKDVASELSSVRLRHPLSHAKKVALLGEIFVRKDYFACQDLLDRLRERDIIVKRAHFFEWLTYCDYLVAKGINEAGFDMKGALEFQVKRMVQSHAEKKIKRIMAQSGLYEYELTDMETIIRYGKNFFDLEFTGEPIVVAGCFFRDIITHVQGVISIGPFACMPTRVCEEVLSAESTAETKRTLDKAVRGSASPLPVSGKLPFLSIESDGNPFPQIIEARIEAFCLQVERLFQKVEAERNHSPALSNAPVTATYFSGGVKDEDAKESVIKGK